MRPGSWGIALLAATPALACSSSPALGPESPPGPTRADTSVAGTSYRAIGLAVGDVDACVILDDHKLKCWGLNGESELGYGDTTPRGGSPGDMGDALPTVDLGTGRTAQQISVGHYGTCALLDDGGVKCWGSVVGQPGAWHSPMGDALREQPVPAGRRVVSVTTGHNFPLGILDDGRGVVWSDGNAVIPDFHTPSPIKQAAHGLDCTAVLFEDGTDTIFFLPLADPPAPSLPFDIAALSITGDEEELCGRLADGRVTCQSRGSFPVLATDTQAVAVGVNAPKCVLTNDGGVWCRYDDYLGCDVDDPGLTYWCVGQPKDGLIQVRLPQPAVTIGAGMWSACALLTDGSVWCWGSFDEGIDPYNPNALIRAPHDLSDQPWLGAAVAVTTDATGRRVYAGWSAIDLGTHRSGTP
jgi:hypothetical protein